MRSERMSARAMTEHIAVHFTSLGCLRATLENVVVARHPKRIMALRLRSLPLTEEVRVGTAMLPLRSRFIVLRTVSVIIGYFS